MTYPLGRHSDGRRPETVRSVEESAVVLINEKPVAAGSLVKRTLSLRKGRTKTISIPL